MLAHYGVDVLDRRTSLRRVSVLLRRLPSGSWPDADSPLSWSLESSLLAALFDAVQMLTYVTIRAAGGRAQTPKPLPRPTPVRPVGRPLLSGTGTPAKADGWAGLARGLISTPGVVTNHG